MNILSTLLFITKFDVNQNNMNTYATILLWVVPGFMVFMTIEVLYGHFTNKQTYSFMDTLSSLSSGVTNVLKDSLGLVLVILSYPYILDTISVFDLAECGTLASSDADCMPVLTQKLACIGMLKRHALNYSSLFPSF